MKKIALIAAMLAIHGVSSSQETTKPSTYLELGFGKLNYKEPSLNFSPMYTRLLAGKNINEHFGIEGLIGTSIASEKKTIGYVESTANFPLIYGLYAKAFANPTEELEVFGRIGYGGLSRKFDFKSTVSSNSASLSDTGSNYSFGIGAKYAVNKTTSLSVDYMQYYPSKNSVELSGVTVGLSYNF